MAPRLNRKKKARTTAVVLDLMPWFPWLGLWCQTRQQLQARNDFTLFLDDFEMRTQRSLGYACHLTAEGCAMKKTELPLACPC
nr:hypothetical protein [uncultured Rhodoferax sp.]